MITRSYQIVRRHDSHKTGRAEELTQPRTVYDVIENAYGDVFDDRLATRIAGSSRDRIEALREATPVPPDDPPPLAYGQIRPMIFTNTLMAHDRADDSGEFLRALHTLLQAHEVLIDVAFAIPFHRVRLASLSISSNPIFASTPPPSHIVKYGSEEFERLHRAELDHAERQRLLDRLRHLQIIRPFVESGAIRFGAVRLRQKDLAGYAYEMAFKIAKTATGRELIELEEVLPPGPFKDEDSLEGRLVAQGVGMTRVLELARDRRATPLSRSRVENLMWSQVLRSSIGDRRLASLEMLGRIGFPEFRSDVSALVELRRHSDALNTWRSKLTEAIHNLGDLRWDEEITESHKEHFTGVLGDGVAAMSPEQRKSPFLNAMRSGTTEFVVSGVVGAGLGLTAGQALDAAIPAAVLGSTAGAAGSLVQSYTEQRRKERGDRAIWDVWLGMGMTPG